MTTDDSRGLTSGSRPTLKTIAEATGLSLSTVSLSLRGGANLKKETRDKVMEAAQRLGYVPDRAGVRLRTGKTNVLALVMEGTASSMEFTRHLIEGIGRHINRTQYNLNVTPDFAGNGSAETVEHLLKNNFADGIILTGTGPRDPRVQALTDAGRPFVTHGRTEFFSPHAYHDFDSEKFIQISVERLVSQGCKHLLLYSPNEQSMNHHTIVRAFRAAVADHGVRFQVAEGVPPGAPSSTIRQQGYEIATAPNRPDGIICDTEVLGLPLLCGLKDGGLTPGTDIKTVAKQAGDILSTVFPEIDTVSEHVVEAGEELARLLLARINGDAITDLQTLGPPRPSWDMPD